MSREKWSVFGPDAKVLLLLYEHGRVNRSAFQSKYNMNHNSAINSLRHFREIGLTDFEELGDWRDTQIWFLTKNGEVAARKLAELVEYIEGRNRS